MKNITKLVAHICYLALLCLFLTGAGCKEEKEEINRNSTCTEYTTVKSLKDASGIVLFDSVNQRYSISFYKEGTIDGMITAYPCELHESFKEVNLKVVVSGDLFTNDKLPKPAIGGQEMFYIKIKQINLPNN